MLTERASEIVLAGTVLFICLAGPYSAKAQGEDDQKAIKAGVFINDRPASPKKTPSTSRYKACSKSLNTAIATPPPGTTFVQLGVTIWRFRRSTAADKTKELVEDEEGEPT